MVWRYSKCTRGEAATHFGTSAVVQSWDGFSDYAVVAHEVGTHNGGSSFQHIRAMRKVTKMKLAGQRHMTPSAARSAAINKAAKTGTDPLFVPAAREITEQRGKARRAARVDAPAESPAELLQFCKGMSERAQRELHDIWVAIKYVETKGRTCVPFTPDYFIEEAKSFILRAQSQSGRLKCLKLIGDATHDQTSQGLKKLQLGFGGCHFVYG